MTERNTSAPVYSLAICHLYPGLLDGNSDIGNLLVLTQRMRWRGIEPQVLEYHPGGLFPQGIDLIIGGGYASDAKKILTPDLPRIAQPIRELIEAGVPALAVCGSFQMLGTHTINIDGKTSEGVGVFDAYTVLESKRLVGNIITENAEMGTIIGYENHQGRTYLGPSALPFAQVISGAGNNGADKTEGIHYKHAIGTYLHGPLLPKNPLIADYLIRHAFERKYAESLPPLAAQQAARMEAYTDPARSRAMARPR